MTSKDYLMLRSAQRARLEGRKVVMQPVVSILAQPLSAFRRLAIAGRPRAGKIITIGRQNAAHGGMRSRFSALPQATARRADDLPLR